MKIVYISKAILPSRIANSIHIMKMCQAFAKNGHEVILIAPKKTEQYKSRFDDVYAYYGVEKCFEIVKLPWFKIKGRGYIYSYQAARKTKKIKPDLVYSRNVPGAYFVAKFSFPVILESHQPYEDAGTVVQWMFRKLERTSNLKKLVVITEALKKYYETNHPNTKYNIQVAPDGADPAPEEIQSIELPCLENNFHVGYVGHLYKGKGMELIVELASLCKWAIFHIVGGTEKDIKFWKDRCNNLKNVFFHGYIPHNQTYKYIKAFDIVLLPNQKIVTGSGGKYNISPWTSPLKAFEYMAAAKPIISSDLPVLREVLEHNYNALLCSPDDVGAWRRALELLYTDQNLRTRLGSAAYERFLEKYTWNARAKKLLSKVF